MKSRYQSRAGYTGGGRRREGEALKYTRRGGGWGELQEEAEEEEEGWKSHNYVVLSYPGCKKNKIYFF